jgi:monoamine oxidase
LYLLGYQGPGNIRIFGKSNEKYHVEGGNDQVATRLAAALPGQIHLGTVLTALADFGSLTPTQYARRFLGQVEPLLPGISTLWNGRVSLDYWAAYPWTRGAYSYWRVGQYTTIAGSEREAVRSCHFAGEHTSVDFQGYLNGAVESGYRTAREILAALK